MSSWLLYASAVLLTRLCYMPNDRRLPNWLGLTQWAMQLVLVLVLFKWTYLVLALMVYLTIVAAVIQALETPSRIESGFRLFSLIAQLVIPLVVFWLLRPEVEVREFLNLSEQVLLLGFVLLVLLNEANYIIRLLFIWCNVVPKITGVTSGRKTLDEEEYKAGRVIGMLERTLILLLIYFAEDFSAVGFIVAAKGLIRLRQLKDRQFSEYILIGTLASVMCALVGALILLNSGLEVPIR